MADIKKYTMVWIGLSILCFAFSMAKSQTMESFTVAKYLCASVGGGFLALVLILKRWLPTKKL